MSKKVMVGMSGGVDSSVAACLLMEQGYEVSGVTLHLYNNEDVGVKTRTCCSLADVEDARSVASRLGIEHYVFNFGIEFKRDVIGRFAQGYERGETPNPCIDCNRYIKFGKMLERAKLLGIDYIATGHYARAEYDSESGRYLLKKAKDVTKDQTYVLYSMTQDELAHTLFPLGGFCKTEVRKLAEERGFVNARKPDSEDICFVPDGDYAGFLERVMGIHQKPGDFVDGQGKVLGTHKGLIHYTIGQRKGLGLSFESPKYVLKKDTENNTVVLGDNKDLFSDRFTAGDVNFIAFESLTEPKECGVKVRYSQSESPATLIPLEDGKVEVRFKEPQRAVTPGQAAVFYDGDIVLGGGTILADESHH
ncbi:MAG TPA: tRNA 2-thiouridine(34) synthase MnmA [Caproicibacter sp.]|nr:tRNA 2-thiouridine(34) synthase MnmA [Caproicibacter sp.]